MVPVVEAVSSVADVESLDCLWLYRGCCGSRVFVVG
jgi:hypothetical protein